MTNQTTLLGLAKALAQQPYDHDRLGILADALAEADAASIRSAVEALLTTAEFSSVRLKLFLDLRGITGIKDRCEAIKEAQWKAVEFHVRERKEIGELLRAEQKQCKHESTTYHPDASGNNDWEDECNLCGKRGKRL